MRVGVAANSRFDPPARLEGIYVTALRTFSRNALSKPLGSQAHITGEREQASVTCC